MEHTRSGVTSFTTGPISNKLFSHLQVYNLPDFQAYLERKRKRVRERIEADIAKAAAARQEAEALNESREQIEFAKSAQARDDRVASQKSEKLESSAKEEEAKREDEQVRRFFYNVCV